MIQVDDWAAEASEDAFRLTSQQLAFFETFGFLQLPGLFRADIDEITDAFEQVFAAKAFLQAFGVQSDDAPWLETNYDLHFGEPRVTIPLITERHERLQALHHDPRVVTIVNQVMGPAREWEPTGADGNLFYCDTSWHVDSYGAPINQFHMKLSFYLDPLDTRTGAIRVLPGSNFPLGPYARRLLPLLDEPGRIEAELGVRPDELPSWTIESQPGDLLLWNYRLAHAAFQGIERRRLLSLNFREVKLDSASS